jgi:HEAT repeat protein/beta-lactamase regulating signal transducer with metallopeptidase domain
MTPAHLDVGVAVVLSWLLTYAIHSTLLLGAAAVIAIRFADEHAWLDVLWKVALVGPLVTATVQIGSDVIPLAGRWPIQVHSPVVSAPSAAVSPHSTTAVEPSEVEAVAVPAPWRTEHQTARAELPAPASTSAGVSEQVTRWWPMAVVLSWLAIAAIAVQRFTRRLARLYRVFGSGPAVSTAHLREMLEALRAMAKERAGIRLTTNHACTVPLALAGRQIVLPDRFLVDLDVEHQRAAIAHEIAHVVRRDPAWRIVAGLLECMFFFQPLNRLARARLCDAAEFLCDQWAVQQTRSPLALARCLAIVASWAAPGNEARFVEASAMARSDSPIIRRVTSILNESPLGRRRPSVLWLSIPLALVVIAAPRVSAARLTAAPEASEPSPLLEASSGAQRAVQKDQAAPPRVWTASEIAQARSRVRLHKPPQPTAPLQERWKWALGEAGRQGLGSFWIAYTFATPTHAHDLMISDTRDGSIVSIERQVSQPDLVPLADLLEVPPPAGNTGNVTVLLHYRAARADGIDRAGYRSARLGFEFGRTPVFSLGVATDAESFDRVRQVFEAARNEKVQVLLIELASLHPDTDIVLPFLTRLLEPSNAVAIRSEAAEGFNHHNDPRSVEILLRVARTDSVSEVRAEAAETIGEVQVPQSIPALTDLANNSTDHQVRLEAAEAFGEQPPDLALPAIEQLLAGNNHEEVLSEAVEALASLADVRVAPLLVRIATEHPNPRVQQEAAETLGEIETPDAVPALARIAWEHPNVTVQREAVEALGDRLEAAATSELERIVRDHHVEEVQAEAIETLGDTEDHRLNPLLIEQALSGKSPRLRHEALDAIAHVASGTSDAQTLDKVQQTIEHVIFNDPDSDVRIEAIGALDELPRDRASRVLRNVIEKHPDAEIRQEAKEHR